VFFGCFCWHALSSDLESAQNSSSTSDTVTEDDLGAYAGIYQGNGGPAGCRYPYFIAHVAQISGGNALANAVKSTEKPKTSW
jgi:hypothetical protein